MNPHELIPKLIHAVGKVLAEEGAAFRIKHAELTEAYNELLETAARERGIQKTLDKPLDS